MQRCKTDEEHRKQIDDLCEQLVECCLVSDRFLPKVKLKKSNKPYWREEVQPYKTDSIWGHYLWKQCGETRDGVIYESKSEAHNQYRYATRIYVRKVEELRKVRMTKAICDNRSRDFFREIKKLNPKVSAAPCMDGHVDKSDRRSSCQ